MDLSTLYFPAGVAIGLGSAAPIGPVNLLVIERTMTRNSASALVLGFGGAVGDALFATVAAFGLGAVSGLLNDHHAVIRLIGGVIMLGFAAVIWRSAPRLRQEGEPVPAARVALVALGMTLTNPATLIFFIGGFGAVGFRGIGHDTPEHLLNATLVVLGVMSGSMLWWLLVTAIGKRLRGRVADRHLVLLNHLTAVGLALFGLGAIVAGILAW